jgi:putative membrane protein insertion efficiency factor
MGRRRDAAPPVVGQRRDGGVAEVCLVALLYAYRAVVAPHLVGGCRFVPSCSRYAEEAVSRFGVWRGGGLALRRLLRCHPWQRGGWDPVPEHLPTAGAGGGN